MAIDCITDKLKAHHLAAVQQNDGLINRSVKLDVDDGVA